MRIIENQTFDEERAFYGSQELLIKTVLSTDRQMGKALSKKAVKLKCSAAFSIFGIHSGMIRRLPSATLR